MEPTVQIQREPFDLADEVAALTAGRRDIGAVVTFTGLCRDEAGRLVALELEHFPGMAEDELARVAAEAVRRWPLLGVTVIHRFGRIAPGEDIVLVATAAAHRREAFDAASFLMDFLKTDAPFWKREHLAGGGTGDWIAAKPADETARQRWDKTSDAT